MNKFVVTNEYNGYRLDKFLSSVLTNFSRTHIAKIIDEGEVFVNDKEAKSSLKLKENDVISLTIPENKELEVNKEDIPLDIVYEDKDILIINKPQGMVVHPSNGHNEHTLVNAILYHCKDLSGINGVNRPGIVHRIDKDTSGLICVAKNDNAHLKLAEQLKDHTMARTYTALVKGIIPENSGEINLPIGRDPNNRQKMGVTRTNSKEAITYFKVLKRYKEHTLVECHLKTGRTHQIRVHLSYLNHPIVGDSKYGNFNANRIFKEKYHFANQFLHAYKLGFGDLPQPLTNLSRKEFTAEPNEEIANILTMLENSSED